MLTDCAQLRLDPARLTFWQYQAILHENNRRFDVDAPAAEQDFSRLKTVMRAHGSDAVH